MSVRHYKYFASTQKAFQKSICTIYQNYLEGLMQNPENHSSHNLIPVEIMHQYVTGNNIKWGNNQYKTPRQYLDPLDQILKRKYAEEQKGQADKKYITKRGFYMDYDLKVAKSIPSAAQHSKNSSWNFQHLKKLSKFNKVDQKLSKHTYLDQIQINQQKRKVPGVSSYSLQKSIKQKQKQLDKQKNKKKLEQQRRFFFQDIQFLGNISPGSGNYNPNGKILKLRKDKTDWKHWTEKHKKIQDILFKRNSLKPNSCSYNPMNMTLNTFERMSLSPKGKSKVPGFGTSARFDYQVPDKKKIKQIRPSPAHYKTMLEWNNKNESPRFKPWNTSIWKGKQYETLNVYE